MHKWSGVKCSKKLLDAAGLPAPKKPKLTVNDFKKVSVNCVYFVFDDSGTVPIYIGKTQNIKSRLSGHHKGFSGTEPMSIVSFEMSGMESIAEMIYISAYMPKLNCVVSDAESSKSKKKRYVIL